MRPLYLVFAAALFTNVLCYAYIERLRKIMVTREEFDATLGKVGPALGGLAGSVGGLVTAVKAHPNAPDFTNELTQVQSDLDQLADLKTIIDTALAPASPDAGGTDAGATDTQAH